MSVRARGRSSVSVVVAVTDANSFFLAECLDALGAQKRRPDEVLLVVTGQGLDTKAVVTAQLRASWRVGSVALPGGSVAEALDLGASLVRGTYLMRLEAGDLLTPAALDALAGALDRSGSALGLPGRSPGTRRALTQTPDALVDPDLATVLVRTATVGASQDAVDGPFGRWLPVVRAVLDTADGFDVVDVPVRAGVRRGTGLGFGAMAAVAAWVPAWVAAVEEALAGITATGVDPQPFLHWLLATESVDYLEDVERCSEEQWQMLSSALRRWTGLAESGTVAAVPVEQRVRCWLAAHDRRADLERFTAARWLEDEQRPTRVQEGRVLAELPVTGVPESLLELTSHESRLVTQVRRLAWSGAAELEVEMIAYVRGVGRNHGSAQVAVWLAADKGERVRLDPEVVVDPEVDAQAGERFQDHSAGLLRARIDVAALAAAGVGAWRLDLEWSAAGVTRAATVRQVDRRGSAAALPPRTVAGRTVDFDAASASLRVGDRRPADPVEDRSELTHLTLEGGDLLLAGRTARTRVTLELRGPEGSASTEATVGPVPAGGDHALFTARLALRHDPWALGEAPLPSGSYRLRAAEPEPLVLAPELVARLPLAERSEEFRIGVHREPGGGATVVLATPLRPDETGARAQEGLRRWYASDEHRLDPDAVYLQSYTGQSATDSPLAIHHALRGLHPGLRLRWGVADRSARVPEGAEPVLLRSRQWYAALATSGHIVTNIDLEGWFRKRPGQRLLQTYHGYPSKAMGISAWEAKNLTPLRIDRQLRRTSGTWDLLLTPTPEMDRHYREQYRYDGPILSAGYPRDDVLVGPEAAALRAAARERLGIGERTAVLYAPTWRDDLTTGFRSAPMPSILDVEEAAAALGDEFVLLLRGHRFHRRRPEPGGRLLDVTAYPEVNDLILAADAAVLDYSSLRFDMALTGRPMVFLVPDLERYEGGVRGFLYDFRSSAPGPLVSSTRQVVAALRDLEGVARRHRERYAAFNARFNDRQNGHAAEIVAKRFLDRV